MLSSFKNMLKYMTQRVEHWKWLKRWRVPWTAGESFSLNIGECQALWFCYLLGYNIKRQLHAMLLGKAMCTRLHQPVRIDRNSRNYLFLYHEKFTGTDDSTTPASGDAQMLSAEEIHQKGSSPCSYHLPYHLLLLSSFSLLLFFEVHTNYCIWILILKYQYWIHFFFQISTCSALPEALAATVGPQTLARRVPRPLLSPWPLSRASEELWRKKGRPMDARKKAWTSREAEFTPWKPDIQKNKKKYQQKCSTSEKKHDTGGIVKGSGTPSCFGFCWQVRVAQAWNSPLMGGCGRLKLQGESSGVCHTICRPSNGVSHVTSSTFKQFFKNPGFFHGSKFSWHGEDVNSWDPGSLGAWYLQWIGG